MGVTAGLVRPFEPSACLWDHHRDRRMFRMLHSRTTWWVSSSPGAPCTCSSNWSSRSAPLYITVSKLHEQSVKQGTPCNKGSTRRLERKIKYCTVPDGEKNSLVGVERHRLLVLLENSEHHLRHAVSVRQKLFVAGASRHAKEWRDSTVGGGMPCLCSICTLLFKERPTYFRAFHPHKQLRYRVPHGVQGKYAHARTSYGDSVCLMALLCADHLSFV